MLAALAGILIAPTLTLSASALTLLIVNAYAASVIGRLRSIPMTFVGAIILGLSIAYSVAYLPQNPYVQVGFRERGAGDHPLPCPLDPACLAPGAAPAASEP